MCLFLIFCFICLFLGVLTHFILFVVQFIVRVNFNRLQSKYECLCIVLTSVRSISVLVEN